MESLVIIFDRPLCCQPSLNNVSNKQTSSTAFSAVIFGSDYKVVNNMLKLKIGQT